MKREITRAWPRRYGTEYCGPNRKGSPSLKEFARACVSSPLVRKSSRWLANKAENRRRGGGRGARRIGGIK